VLPTFVIGLREGLEAALIVGIIAAFLARQNRRDALRQVWVGVLAAVAICLGIAVALQLLERVLPQRQQEMLETVVGILAVVMVTGMIVWMRRHARAMKGELEGAAAAALAEGSARALVAMAFLAVLREGFETSVFLLATFQASGNATTAGIGAVLGILVAVALGWGIFHGGVRLNMGRFFTLTSAVLVLVAAGLVMTAVHTAHEAGWVNIGQGQAADLTWLVQPGTPIASLLTGVLGIQPTPTVLEVLGWALYVVPMLVFVLRPPRAPAKDATRRAESAGSAEPARPAASTAKPVPAQHGSSHLSRQI
jgi:high-affinity iron transporter